MADVRIVGNRNVPVEKIVPHVRTRAGRRFDPEVIEEDVRRLNKSRMFVSVKPYTRRVPEGVIVFFEVLERPTLQHVKYMGNKAITEKTLKKQADIKQGDALDPFAVEEARRKLEAYYREKGFSKVRVTVSEGSKPDDRGAVYLINEGPKQRILWTEFVGNTIASDARLTTQVKSKPGFVWIFKGEVDQKEIDEDINRLTAYYRGLGFFSAKVGHELRPLNESQNWVILTFVIDEGSRYKIRNASILGNTKFSTQELSEKLKLKSGQYFNQAQMTTDVASIQDKYGGIGYIFADVKADPRFLEDQPQLDLVYNIKEGDRYRVGRINIDIKGEYPHTRITTVLNRLSLRPGDIVDVRELRASERRLQASQLFLVDPASGVRPKIVFSPPELEKEQKKEVARQPQRPPGFRGQSPDPEPYAAYWAQCAAEFRAGDRLIDLSLQGQWVQPEQAPQVQQPVSPPSPARLRPTGQTPPADGQRPMIVRAQYTPESGQSMPSLQPGLPWTGSRPAVSESRSQPLAPPYPPPSDALPPGQVAPPVRPSQLAPGPSAQAAPPSSSPTTFGSQVFSNPQLPRGSSEVPGQLPAAGQPLLSDGPVFAHPTEDDLTRPLALDVEAKETQTGRFMFGVGVNSDAGLIGSIVVDEQNFDWTRFPRSFEEIRNATAWRGAGQGFRLEAVPGTQLQRYMINFREPYLLDSDVSLGLGGFYYTRRYQEWDEQRVGGRASLGYQFNHDLSGSFTFRGERVTISNPIYDPILHEPPRELSDVLGHNALYGFQLQLAHDTRDNAFLATEGHLIELSFEQVVGTFEYPRVEVDLRRYFLIHQRPDGSGRHVLSLVGRMGVTANNTPVYDNYFAGGFSTIRGFEFRGASPRSVGGVAIGGHVMLLGSMEYLFPITADDMLRAVVFCDTGTVEPSFKDWTNNYRVSPGFGLRIMVPAMGPAPIALDFAFPAALQHGDRVENFSFFIGFGR